MILGSEDAFSTATVREEARELQLRANEDGNIPLKRIAQQVTRRMEHDLILKVLQANHWNRRKTAEVLKISYRALLYKVRQAGLPARRPQRKIEPATQLPVGVEPGVELERPCKIRPCRAGRFPRSQFQFALSCLSPFSFLTLRLWGSIFLAIDPFDFLALLELNSLA